MLPEKLRRTLTAKSLQYPRHVSRTDPNAEVVGNKTCLDSCDVIGKACDVEVKTCVEDAKEICSLETEEDYWPCMDYARDGCDQGCDDIEEECEEECKDVAWECTATCIEEMEADLKEIDLNPGD